MSAGFTPFSLPRFPKMERSRTPWNFRLPALVSPLPATMVVHFWGIHGNSIAVFWRIMTLRLKMEFNHPKWQFETMWGNMIMNHELHRGLVYGFIMFHHGFWGSTKTSRNLRVSMNGQHQATIRYGRLFKAFDAQLSSVEMTWHNPTIIPGSKKI